MEIKKAYLGKWRIQSMELWDKDFIDLVVPGQLAVEVDGTDSLQFGAVEVDVDCRVESFGGIERLEFSFEGEDEGDLFRGEVGQRLLEQAFPEGFFKIFRCSGRNFIIRFTRRFCDE